MLLYAIRGKFPKVKVTGEVNPFVLSAFSMRSALCFRCFRDNRIKLYTKGADNILYGLITKESRESSWDVCEADLNSFAEAVSPMFDCYASPCFWKS